MSVELGDGTTMLEHALDLLKRGFSVFPLFSVTDGACDCEEATCDNQGKHPFSLFCPHGLKDATKDESRVRAWWSEYSDANIGVLTGNGIVVVDIDPRHE